MTFALATVDTGEGARAALVSGGRFIVLGQGEAAGLPATMIGLIERFDPAPLEALAQRAGSIGEPLDEAKLLPPTPDPGAIFCAGSNYMDHAAEMAARMGRPPPRDPHELGQRSWHFLKTRHCLAGSGAHVRLHPRSARVDWEIELAAIIGRKAFQVSERDALDYVFGYTAAIDLSARDLGRREGLAETSSFRHDWVSHKVWDGSCPFGPWIALARDIPDPQVLDLVLDVNGEVKQRSNTSRMTFSLREQIADLSRNFTLWPGDVILTGTPAGVGASRGEFLRQGDVLRARIDRIGELVTIMA